MNDSTMILKAVSMMKSKAVLSFLLCIALFAGLLVLPAAAAQSTATTAFDNLSGTMSASFITQVSRRAGLYFDANGGTGTMAAAYADFEGWVTVPACTFTRTGYTFAGWNSESDGSGTALEPGFFILSLQTDLTLYAQWEPIPIPTSIITFDSHGGSAVAPITQDEGTPITAPANPVKAGFDFTGWMPAVPAIMPEDDLTCVAQWEIPYDPPGECDTIHFDLGGGSWGYDPYIIFDEGIAIVAPLDPTKEGYTFSGWEPPIPAYCPVDDITCVAQWEPIVVPQHTITFDANGGVGSEVQTVEEGVVPTAPIVTREGYSFLGWDAVIVAAENDATYTAQWEELLGYDPVICFDSNGGTPIDPIVVHPGELIISPPDPTREGYCFLGWEPPLPATIEHDMCFVAQWEPIVQEHFIILDPNGGRWDDGSTAPRRFYWENGILIPYPRPYEGTPITPPPIPTRDGYAFCGWTPFPPASYPEEEFTCYAQWEPYTSTITFDSAGGSPVDSITQDEGTAVTPPADPTKAGYIFAGWSPAVPAIMPEDDITCTAQWNLLGDINGDGSITPLDALMALQGSTGEYVLSALQRLAADANHDGRISSMDALMLLRAASGLITL